MQFLIRIIVNAVALWVATLLVGGVVLSDGPSDNKALTLVLVALIFGLVNAVIRPIVKLFTLPLFILSLGLFTFVVNALMLLLTSWLSGKFGLAFHVDGFWAALLGSLVVTVVSFVLNLVLPSDD